MKNKTNLASQDIKFRNSVDGIWDMGIGLAFLIAALAFMFDLVALSGALFFPVFLLMVGFRQRFVYPRIGYVKHKGMEDKTRKTYLITLIIGVFMLILAFMAYLSIAKGQKSGMMRNLAENYGAIVLGLVIAFIVALIGKTYSMPRFYIYSFLVVAAFTLISLIKYEFMLQISLLSLGGAIFVVGLIVFIMFLKKYPRLESDDEK